jgi:hypothetical protein
MERVGGNAARASPMRISAPQFSLDLDVCMLTIDREKALLSEFHCNSVYTSTASEESREAERAIGRNIIDPSTV